MDDGKRGTRRPLRGLRSVRPSVTLRATRNGMAVRVAVVGAGAFGRNHLRVYRELERAGYPVELAAVVDPG